jgi:hypothetical protein
MDFQDVITRLSNLIGEGFLNLLAGIGILLIGWLVALIASAAVRSVLRRTNLDDRLAQAIAGDKEEAGKEMEKWTGRGVFYLIMLFALVAFFQTLNLTTVAEPLTALLEQVFAFVPQLVGAVLILVIAWIIGSVVRFAVLRAVRLFKLEDRLTDTAALDERVSIGEPMATAAFWFIFLLFLPAVLSTLGLEGLVEPVQQMFSKALAALPNAFGAAIIMLVGWFIARIVRQIVVNLLAAAGADRLGERIGLTTQSLSKVIGTIVYTLILIPTLIAALNALNIEALSGPAVVMLTTALNAVPVIFGAVLVLGLAYAVGRLLSGLVTNLLTGVGFNQWPAKLGIKVQPVEGERTPAEIVGLVTLVAIMLFAVIEAANLLNFDIMAEMLANFVSFGGQVLLALAVFAIGLYLANLTRRVILSAGGKGALFGANVARVAILVLVGAMALQQMGIANEIVNLAFGILLGALGIAAALAFGLGSREVAAREVEKWLQAMQEGQPAEKESE